MIGRPKKYGEETIIIPIVMPISLSQEIEKTSKKIGISKSEYIIINLYSRDKKNSEKIGKIIKELKEENKKLKKQIKKKQEKDENKEIERILEKDKQLKEVIKNMIKVIFTNTLNKKELAKKIIMDQEIVMWKFEKLIKMREKKLADIKIKEKEKRKKIRSFIKKEIKRNVEKIIK